MTWLKNTKHWLPDVGATEPFVYWESPTKLWVIWLAGPSSDFALKFFGWPMTVDPNGNTHSASADIVGLGEATSYTEFITGVEPLRGGGFAILTDISGS